MDAVETMRRFPGALAELIRDVPLEKLTWRPGVGKWSVVEILVHLADDEIVTAWRYRQMIENSGVLLAGFDQDLWARLGHSDAWEPAEALQLFTLLRKSNLRMLDSLTPDEWEHHGMHAERGRITVRDLALHMAGHDANHQDQISKMLAH